MKYLNSNNIIIKQCNNEVYLEPNTFIENSSGTYTRYTNTLSKELVTFRMSNVKCSMFLTGFKIINGVIEFKKKLKAIKKI